MVTQKDIHALLKACGVRSENVVTVHTSLRAVGNIENGADGLIDGFCSYLREGLFLVPTHTWANVNRQNPVYDVRTTVPCIGTLPQVAAFREDGFRSLHPTHSLTGFGERAKAYLSGEEHAATPTPVGGAMSRLYDENAKILLIGVGHERNTFLHAVEEELDIPNRIHPEGFAVTVCDHEGRTIPIPAFHPHRTVGIACGLSEYYPRYKEALEHTGAVTYAQLGNALVTCCDAKKTADTLRLLWKQAEEDLCLSAKPIPKSYYLHKKY